LYILLNNPTHKIAAAKIKAALKFPALPINNPDNAGAIICPKLYITVNIATKFSLLLFWYIKACALDINNVVSPKNVEPNNNELRIKLNILSDSIGKVTLIICKIKAK